MAHLYTRGRCRQPIEAETLAVRFPGCGICCRKGADLPCFTYAEKCAIDSAVKARSYDAR